MTGPGGSIRPTPSPDGKSLAFVRRVRYKSVLFVKNLESGVERPVYDGLERDMQETWAIQGVYPGMAWTPDSKSVVFWAGGFIQRADLASNQVYKIPFHVKDTRKTASAVRFPVDVLTGVMAASASPYISGAGGSAPHPGPLPPGEGGSGESAAKKAAASQKSPSHESPSPRRGRGQG